MLKTILAVLLLIPMAIMVENTDVKPIAEITAIQAVAEALEGLDEPAIRRVLVWAADRYGVSEALTPSREYQGKIRRTTA